MYDCLSDIEHNEIFNLLNEEEMAILNKKRTTVHYKKGDTIIKQGTLANIIVYSKTGSFKLIMEGDQKSIILTLKGSKVFLGLSSFYYVNKIHLYSVIALEDCEVDIYDKNSFKEIVNNNVVFSNEIIKFLNHNSARIYKRFINMTEKNARGKVSNMLLCFANSLYFSYEFQLTLTRQELGEYLGLSTENIIRILKEFEMDKLIKVEGRKIKIINVEALERICNFG